MNEQGYAGVIRRFFRSVILIDTTLVVIMGLISFLLGLSTFEAFGALLISAGIGLIVIACFIGVGGVASRREDIAAFELSGAGDMADNLQRIAEAGHSSLGCFFLLLVAGLGLLILGYLLPIISLLFG